MSINDIDIIILNNKKYNIKNNLWEDNKHILTLSNNNKNIWYIRDNNMEININYKNENILKFIIKSDIDLIKKDYAPLPKSPRKQILMQLEII